MGHQEAMWLNRLDPKIFSRKLDTLFKGHQNELFNKVNDF